MRLLALIYGFVPGILFGIMISKQITARLVKRSNDIGDYGAELVDFTEGFEVICHEESVANVY